jgi:hypothetical protein
MNTRFPDNPICPMSSPKGQSGIGGPDVEWLAASLILPSEKIVIITVRERRVLQALREITQAEPVNMITAEEGKEDWREPF